MVAGRNVALIAVVVAGMLAFLDVRPDTRPAPGHTGSRLDLAEVAPGPVPADVQSVSALRPGPARETNPADGRTVEVNHVFTGGNRERAVVVDRGDGHSFGYARAPGGTRVESSGRRPSEGLPAPITSNPARNAARPWAWTWRPGDNSGSAADTRVAWTDAVATVRHNMTPINPAPDGTRAIRVTQTLAYFHGAAESDASSEGGVEVTLPEDPTGSGIDLVPEGSDTGVDSGVPTEGAAPKAATSRHQHGSHSSPPPPRGPPPVHGAGRR